MIKQALLTADALNSADIALQPVIEEWVETYQSAANDETSERAAMYELISCVVRCCGVTADVEEDETLDVDGVPDAVERIQDESLKVKPRDRTPGQLAHF